MATPVEGGPRNDAGADGVSLDHDAHTAEAQQIEQLRSEVQELRGDLRALLVLASPMLLSLSRSIDRVLKNL